jgi:energy-coupling factor transporter ATP-binding protein EcfA2
LISDVEKVWIDRDNARDSLTLMVTTRNGTPLPAKSLSDGTLRFLALAVLALDQESPGLICVEEPENGIHPERIPKILQLLQEIATDTDYPIGPDNLLRQVIISTHSPAVVAQIPEDCLLVVELHENIRDGQRFQQAHFGYLPHTWRQTKDLEAKSTDIISKGKLMAYLNPVLEKDLDENDVDLEDNEKNIYRVIDRADLRSLMPGLERVGD